ncbi:unnamed protein product [Moneuplotes crassus]|uniref:AP2/ERF domain-containing protein n=1 Tax=Euplotes crassus TaxID=5936 RepID=A0AAD1Y434_EUPCR|nr:unnamed protein product [Moneuplotes crassus]
MGWVLLPTTPQLIPIVQAAQMIPDISAYCQCSFMDPECASSRVLFDKRADKPKQEFTPSEKCTAENSKEVTPETINFDRKISKLDLVAIPRKHKARGKILQRLSSLCSDSKILSEIENIPDSDEFIIRATSKSQASEGANQTMRSRYIGVCHKNGMYNSYIVANGKKTYICGTRDEELSARYYDYCAILLHGRLATTNFSYTKRQLVEILTSVGTCSES